MNTETKLLAGKFLGELYRIQRHLNVPNAPSAATVYALLNGFEPFIDAEVSRLELITKEEVDNTEAILNDILHDPARHGSVNSFYQIEEDLKERNVMRGKAIKILKMLSTDKKYKELIEKMNESYSLVPSKRFLLNESDL